MFCKVWVFPPIIAALKMSANRFALCQRYPTDDNATPPTTTLSQQRRLYLTYNNATPPTTTLPHLQQCHPTSMMTLLGKHRLRVGIDGQNEEKSVGYPQRKWREMMTNLRIPCSIFWCLWVNILQRSSFTIAPPWSIRCSVNPKPINQSNHGRDPIWSQFNSPSLMHPSNANPIDPWQPMPTRSNQPNLYVANRLLIGAEREGF